MEIVTAIFLTVIGLLSIVLLVNKDKQEDYTMDECKCSNCPCGKNK